jgi:A/G-specific adenine glycosylase
MNPEIESTFSVAHISQEELDSFRDNVISFYRRHKRILPWREKITAYGVFISEVMLQQTQVARVLLKYPAFILRFPDFESLSKAPFERVLREWKGMGYNRRALFLQKSAISLLEKYKGVVPDDPQLIDELPGIGSATAHSIATFIYNKPYVFIETNIRRVFIHHFFVDHENIDDAVIMPLIERTVDQKNPRDWYYALMDYGSYLATQVVNPNRRSKHYVRQTPFEDSNRQLRGKILEIMLQRAVVKSDFGPLVPLDQREKLDNVLNQLEKEGFIVKDGEHYTINDS